MRYFVVVEGILLTILKVFSTYRLLKGVRQFFDVLLAFETFKLKAIRTVQLVIVAPSIATQTTCDNIAATAPKSTPSKIHQTDINI